MVKAIALLSGGLDSILATRLILDQGIEVEGVNFLTVFCTCTPYKRTCLASKSAANKLGIKLKVFEISKEYIKVVKNPKYGYGRNINPCLDCRIFMFKKAGEYMRDVGAKFLITGEVLGERPMSQREEAMRIIERDSRLEGLIVRPLSARLLQPTLPEKEGIVEREKLLDIQGRSRKPQMRLAKDMGISDYPCPAGGCLLADPQFAKRMKDLMRYNPDFTLNDIQLLKLGRHFRLSDNAKLVVGRNEEENRKLMNLVREDDILFKPQSGKGPVGIGRGDFNQESIFLASQIIARYSDGGLKSCIEIINKSSPDAKENLVLVCAMEEERLSILRI
ncbi:MAG: hypothetical protein NC822_01770 [Candidatus Omnitrophica bacterium]|nr:hypothetical protein [Candidatus Omnitrophota bacterium]MCM8826979.1 hypothetical protein [Candidatus Omnitrophota bacterium]